MTDAAGELTDERTSDQLLWRIPTSDRLSLRTRRRMHLLIVTLILSSVLILGLFLAARVRGEAGNPGGLLALLPLIGLMLFYVLRGVRRSHDDRPNIRLDREGLHWTNSDGSENTIARRQMESFRIGLDPDTVRTIPALTLILVGGFESQPIELHEPAVPQATRQFLLDELRLAEQESGEFARRFHSTLTAVLDRNWGAPEMRLLRYTMLDPIESQPNGTWLVCRFPDNQSLTFQRADATFQMQSSNGRTTRLETIEAVALHVRDDQLPRGEFDRQEFLADLETTFTDKEEAAIRREAREAGFFVQGDEHGHMYLAGSRKGLLAFCKQVEQAARMLRSEPLGARPDRRIIGGDVMRVVVQLGRDFWIEVETISGPKDDILGLIGRVRQQLHGAEAGSELTVRFSDSRKSPVAFKIYLKDDDYDPASSLPEIS